MYKKTNLLSEPVSPEIAAFCVRVENHLQREGYPDVTGWEQIPLPFLIRQLESKVKELLTLESRPGELFVEMVVIGSISMMAAELAARQSRAERGKADLRGHLLLKSRMMCPNGSSRGGQE
jgi:hypothetical protein